MFRLLTKIKRKIKSFFGYKGGYSVENKQTYFSIPELGLKGRRPGTDIQTRLQGLEYILAKKDIVSNATILDAGCAEGLVSYEFYKQGAGTIHGFDLQKVSIAVAKKVFATNTDDTFFGQADLINWDNFLQKYKKVLLPQYDIVLFLSIYGHMVRKDKEKTNHTLIELADKAKKYLIVRSTAPIPEELILERGFVVEHRDPAPDANALTIFCRI